MVTTNDDDSLETRLEEAEDKAAKLQVRLVTVEEENAQLRRRLVLLEDDARTGIAALRRVIDNIAAVKRELQH